MKKLAISEEKKQEQRGHERHASFLIHLNSSFELFFVVLMSAYFFDFDVWFQIYSLFETDRLASFYD